MSRILLVALDNLGDLVFASALAPPLARAFPGATLDLWCKRYTAPVAALIPHVHRVIAADPFWAVAPGHKRPNPLEIVRSVLAVRRAHYDIAVLSEAPWRAAAAVAATGIPVRIGLARHRNARFLTHVLPPEDPGKPVVQEQARLLAPLGVGAGQPRYALDASRLGSMRAQIAQRLPARVAAVHPFASLPRKRAPLAEWLAVADGLRARNLAVLWIGRTIELDEIRARRATAGAAGTELYIDEVTDGSLGAAAAALSLATLFVGHDSGPMHVANAFGVRVVDVFSTGSPVRYGPQGTGPARVLYRERGDQVAAGDILRECDALLATQSAGARA